MMKKKWIAILLVSVITLTNMEAGALAVSGADFTSGITAEIGTDMETSGIETEAAEFSIEAAESSADAIKTVAETGELETESVVTGMDSTNENMNSENAAEVQDKEHSDYSIEQANVDDYLNEEEIMDAGVTIETGIETDTELVDKTGESEEKEVTGIRFIPERTTYTILEDESLIEGSVELTYKDGSSWTVKYGSEEYEESNIELCEFWEDDYHEDDLESGRIFWNLGTYKMYFEYEYEESNYYNYQKSDYFYVTVDLIYENCQKIEPGKEYKVTATDKPSCFTFTPKGDLYRYLIETLDGKDAQEEGQLYYYDTEDNRWASGDIWGEDDCPAWTGNAEKSVLIINSGISVNFKILPFYWPVSVTVEDGQLTEFTEGTQINLDSFTFKVTYEDQTIETLKIGQNDRYKYRFLTGSLYKKLSNGEYTRVNTKYPSTGEYVYDLFYSRYTVVIDSPYYRYFDIPIKINSSSNIKLNVSERKTLPLAVKQSFNVKVSGLAKDDSVKSWKSSNTKVVSVNKKGKIVGKKAGTAKITVTLKSGLSTWFKVKVQKSAVATTSLTVKNKSTGKTIGKTLTLKRKKSITLSVTVAPVTSKQKVTYSTSNKKIVTVTSKGVIKAANKEGTAYITVKSGKKSKKIKVTVK